MPIGIAAAFSRENAILLLTIIRFQIKIPFVRIRIIGGNDMGQHFEHQYQKFINLLKELDHIYHQLSLRNGMSDSTMWVLFALREADRPLTQAEVAESVSTSRQTIHSTIKNLLAKGYLAMDDQGGKRKNKALTFTDSGEAFAKAHIDPILEMDRASFEQFSPDDRATFLRLTQEYVIHFREATGIGPSAKQTVSPPDQRLEEPRCEPSSTS